MPLRFDQHGLVLKWHRPKIGTSIGSRMGRDVLQLKTGIRLDSLKSPFKKSIEAAARLEVDAVEINLRTGIRMADMSRTAIRHLNKLLGDRELSVCSLTFPTRRPFYELEELDRRLEATRQVMSLAFELGTRVVTGSSTTIPDPEQDSQAYQVLVSALTDLARHGQRVGCQFALSFPTEPARVNRLLEEIPPGVGIDLDPADLLSHGLELDSYLQQNAFRSLQFRARDAVRDFAKGRSMEVQLGRGSVDLPSLLGLLEEKNYQGYFVVESADGEEPEVSCANALEYLKQLFG